MNGRRSIGVGCATAIAAASIGAATGWWVTGPPKNDPELHALVGLIGGAIVGFAIGGPRGSGVIAGLGLVGTIVGGFLGGFLTQDEGLGSVMGMVIGAGAGLVAGIAVGIATIIAQPEK